MRRLFPLYLSILLASALLGACAPHQPKIQVTPDSTLEAREFSSWNFIDPLSIETAGYPPEVVSAFKDNIALAMTAKGYERSDDPQLLLNVATDINNEGSSSLQSDAYQAIHPQRGTFHNSWRGYGEGFGASSRQQRYGDGQINIGIVALPSRVMVWEAIAEGRLSGKRSPEEQAAIIESVTQQMLSQVPPAGSNENQEPGRASEPTR